MAKISAEEAKQWYESGLAGITDLMEMTGKDYNGVQSMLASVDTALTTGGPKRKLPPEGVA